MSSINRNITRTILNTTETTFQTQTPASDTVAFVIDDTDTFFIGFKEPFASRYFHFGTLNATTRTVTVKYSDGTTFQDVEDIVDQTRGFTQSGFLSWVNKNDWKKTSQTPIVDRELFWIKITVDATLDGGTTLQSLLNLYCDENLLRAYYPELVSDSRYLPPGRTDLIEQLQAAKELVTLRLKQDKIILDESQILDINEVAVATAHAAAWIILHSIAVSDGEKEQAKDAFDVFNHELNRVKIDLDIDNTGIITEAEENVGNAVLVRGFVGD